MEKDKATGMGTRKDGEYVEFHKKQMEEALAELVSLGREDTHKRARIEKFNTAVANMIYAQTWMVNDVCYTILEDIANNVEEEPFLRGYSAFLLVKHWEQIYLYAEKTTGADVSKAHKIKAFASKTVDFAAMALGHLTALSEEDKQLAIKEVLARDEQLTSVGEMVDSIRQGLATVLSRLEGVQAKEAETQEDDEEDGYDEEWARLNFGKWMEDLLGEVVSLPKEDKRARFEKFQDASVSNNVYAKTVLLNDACFPILMDQFVYNDEEEPFLRGYAAYLLARHFEHTEKEAEAVAFASTALNHFKSVSVEDSQIIIKVMFLSDTTTVSIGELVAKLMQVLSNLLEDLEDPKEAILKLLQSFGNGPFSQPGVAEEMVKLIPSSRSITDFFHQPPTLNSETMGSVKALPVSDKTFIIVKESPEKRRERLSSCPSCILEFMLSVVEYEVIRVKMERFDSGKRNKLFESIIKVDCGPTNSHQKNILSAFAVACQKPYMVTPGSEQVHPPERPRRVLLETADDATHPQVTSFLSMMGCSEVDVAPPELLKLLKEAKDEKEVHHKVFSKEHHPHMYDVSRGIQCGNCELVGPQLKPCPCGKVYYCSIECQKAKWKGHKHEHKVAMKKKEKKGASK